MNLSQAFRLFPPPSLQDTSPKSAPLCPPISKFRNGGMKGGQEGVALVGSGGKTTALFQLARELTAPPSALPSSSFLFRPSSFVTSTTHLGAWQASLADRHFIAEELADLSALEESIPPGVTLVTGPLDGDRLGGLNEKLLSWLRAKCQARGIPLLIEADGARQKPLKAPADHEPVIPKFVEMVVVVAGLSGLGKPLTEEFVHRPEIFARLSGLAIGDKITPEAVVRVLTHPAGGLKSIPKNARRVALLNQADTPLFQGQGKYLAELLLKTYESVVVNSFESSQVGKSESPNLTTCEPANLQTCKPANVFAVYERTAGIILAAGESKRFGQPKQLLDWHGKPFVRAVAETALAAGLSPVVVVTGAYADAIKATIHHSPFIINHSPLTIHHNPDWQNGQSASIQTGLHALPPGTGAAIFLLADQPQVTATILRALAERHSLDLCPVVAPQVHGQRANPVLFDRVTFPDLMSLSGDVGGRAVFSKFPVTYLPWHDESLLVDVDVPGDLEKLE
jgi:molybdenum cofactor cytidylyltransferase